MNPIKTFEINIYQCKNKLDENGNIIGIYDNKKFLDQEPGEKYVPNIECKT